jgi:hypothetical protein
MTKHLDTLMQREVTRKEFLATVGFGVASIFGFSTLIHLLTGKSFGVHHSGMGYGSSSYGGAKSH